MSITVKNLIEKYSAIQESQNVTESSVQINLGSNDGTDINSLSEEELKVLSALNTGVVTEKVLKERREARNQ